MSSVDSYSTILKEPTTRTVWIAGGVSQLGDFVGLAGLLLLALERTNGEPLGPAVVFASQGLPAVLSGPLLGARLDRISRRTALQVSYIVGGLALLLPLVFGGLWPVLVTAGVLGVVRTAYTSAQSGAIAEVVRPPARAPLIALLSTSSQLAQVLGYVAGTALALTVGTTAALAADAATFGVGAVILLGLPHTKPRQKRAPQKPRTPRRRTSAVGAILGDPTLSVVAPLAWITFLTTAVPEALAASAVPRGSGWLPAALAAGPAGAAIASVFVGQTRLGDRVRLQFRYAAIGGSAVLLGGAFVGMHPAALVVVNLVAGLSTGWAVATQATFIRVAPARRMAHVTGTMVAALIICEGLGALLFAGVASVWSITAAYVSAGTLQLSAALAAYAALWRRPDVEDLHRPFQVSVVEVDELVVELV